MSWTMIRSPASSSLIQSMTTRIRFCSLGFSKDFGSIMDLSSFSSNWYSSGGISDDLGIPGESMACFPSTSTSLTSSTFFFLPRVPTLFQMVSPEFPFFGVEVAAGEFALLGLGEFITELLPLDLERDIFEAFFDKSQRLKNK